MHATKKKLKQTHTDASAEIRSEEWDDMLVKWEVNKKEVDVTPFLKGLPNDLCQCPHYGFLVKGRMKVKYKDHEEIINEGEVYYLTPGHAPILEKGTERIEFSPMKELQKTMAAAAKNSED